MEVGWFAAATEGSDAGALARTVDWSATSLGAPDTWPVPLRTAAEICWSTRFPMLVVWGPDLVMLYNDGYRELLGDKHPAAMGEPVLEVWSEIRDVIGPLFDKVMATGEPTLDVDELLVTERSGFVEDAWFTWSYSALRDEEGRVCGVLDVAIETTDQVIGRRRLRVLGELTSMLQTVAGDVGEVCRVAAEVLLGHPDDVVAADLFVRADDDLLLLASTRGRAGLTAVDGELLRRVAADLSTAVVGTTVVAPLAGPGDDEAVGVLVLEASPRRPLDDAYRSFLGLLSAAVGTAVSVAFRRMRELGELRRVSEALQLSMLPVVGERPGLATRYLPAVGNLAVGGDWYDVVDLADGRRALLVGDCVGNGLDAAALMGQLRSASRALLLENHGAAATIDGLDRFARSIDGAECTTVFCGIVDDAARTITYASAGHPPPLLLRSDGPAWLDDSQDIPLGIDERERRERTAPLRPGDTLVLYTDGLVERRHESLDDGFDRLAAVAAAAGESPTVEQLADAIVDALLPEGARDDVAILVHRPLP